jgi:predicted anti-sigma-YlaC factor YlaD
MQKCDNTVAGKKLTRYKSSVRGRVVIIEQPVACVPQFRSFSPNVLLQTAKNIEVELGIHGLAFGGKSLEC